MRWDIFLLRLTHWQVALERFSIEIVLAICTGYGAVALGTGGHGDLWPGSYALSPWLPGSEHAWAWVMAASCVSNMIGLVLCWFRPLGGYPLRVTGLAMGGLIWSSLGMARLLQDPHTLLGMPGFMMGVSAWWVLLRSPAIRQ